MLFAEPFNPMLADGSLFVWNAVIVVTAAIILTALISIYRNRASLTLLEAVIWFAAVIIAPLLGSLVWLFLGRRLHGVTAELRVERSSIR